MARYQLILAYDGSDFQGFQRQGKKRTVQGEVEKALHGLGWLDNSILAAGRTDTGVHATGQVIAFDLNWAHDPETLGRALNASLPQDVAVKSVRIAAADFHPRYDANWRQYQYRLYFQPARSPLRDRYAWRVWPELDLEKMQAAAEVLIGTHDFAAFGAPPKKGNSTVREVFVSHWLPEPGGACFEIRANAFLYHMVRRVVYLLVQVGEGRLDVETLQRGVEDTGLLRPGLAPPQGLVLVDVGYLQARITRDRWYE